MHDNFQSLRDALQAINDQPRHENGDPIHDEGFAGLLPEMPKLKNMRSLLAFVVEVMSPNGVPALGQSLRLRTPALSVLNYGDGMMIKLVSGEFQLGDGKNGWKLYTPPELLITKSSLKLNGLIASVLGTTGTTLQKVVTETLNPVLSGSGMDLGKGCSVSVRSPTSLTLQYVNGKVIVVPSPYIAVKVPIVSGSINKIEFSARSVIASAKMGILGTYNLEFQVIS